MTKILVIDDNEDVRETLLNILEDAGYEMVAAHDGVSGIMKFASEEPDLVITDIFMPNQDGIQTIREILRLRPDARILAASGGMNGFGSETLVNDGFYLRMAQKLGALDIIAKPFEVDDLVDRVKCLLAGPTSLPQTHTA